MKNSIVKYEYGEHEVEFVVSSELIEVNASQMLKVGRKRMSDYLDLKSTQDFTDELVKYLNRQLEGSESRYGNFGSNDSDLAADEGLGDGDSRFQQSQFTADDVIKIRRGGRRQGTWMHRIQALHFAAWLDARFAVWVFVTIDKILFEQQRQQETQLSQAALKEIRRRELEAKFASNPEYIELQSLRGARSQYLSKPRQQAETQLSIFVNDTLRNRIDE